MFIFRYAKDRMVNGPVFGSKDMFSGLAIIADTYSNHNGPHNHNHPYLSAMVNNGSLSYDHDTDGTHTMIGGCEVKFRNMEHETVIAIRYEGDKLTVSHDLNNRRTWEPCFSIGGVEQSSNDFHLFLTSDGVKLPTGYYFGMSATTGDLSDNHDVISLKVRTALNEHFLNTEYIYRLTSWIRQRGSVKMKEQIYFQRLTMWLLQGITRMILHHQCPGSRNFSWCFWPCWGWSCASW